jgi:hypothetical protein
MPRKFRGPILIALFAFLLSLGCRKNSNPPLVLEEYDPTGYIPCLRKLVYADGGGQGFFLSYRKSPAGNKRIHPA